MSVPYLRHGSYELPADAVVQAAVLGSDHLATQCFASFRLLRRLRLPLLQFLQLLSRQWLVLLRGQLEGALKQVYYMITHSPDNSCVIA